MNSIDVSNSTSAGGSSNITITERTDYVEFQFENGEKVSNWRTKGVNYGYKTAWKGPKVRATGKEFDIWLLWEMSAALTDLIIIGVLLGNAAY
jgi:hypothetical protein